jgi:glycopeptide antibiotics resistance protein
VPKKVWLVLAWAWTIAITVLCLISFTELPKVKIEGADKYVHAILHFIFVLVWCQHYRVNKHLREPRLLAKALLFSVVFGCAIEIAQEYLTTSRQADVKDVLANFSGAAIAVLLQLALAPMIKRNPE